MRLDPFITDLLYDHDCVILPEFGGLVANYRSARLNVISHLIQPPSKHIGFNPSLKYNDGLLTSYISSALGISYKDAADQLAQTLTEYRRLLSSEGRFSIDRIGVFYKDRLGQVQFIPEEQENFLLASHGLKPIQLKLVGGLADGSSESGKVIEMNSNSTLRKWKVAAAILVPAMLVGSWMLGSRVSNHGEMSFASLNPFGEARKQSMYAPVETSWDLPMNFPTPEHNLLSQETATAIDFVNGVADDEGITLNKIPTASESSTSSLVEENSALLKPAAGTHVTAKVVSESHPSTSAYTLIGGAFQVKENAQRLIDQLRSQGYDAQFAGMKDNLHLVAYGHFNTRAEAEALKNKVQGDGAKAWIRTNQ
jgi:hypothetical protein